MKSISFLLISYLSVPLLQAQPFDIFSFDPTSTGPWSEPGPTTLMVPKVANGSVTVDGAPSAQEYGGFEGVTVEPGVNAWILDFPGDRAWDGPEDSSFTFWLAHDDQHFYVGVDVKDDVVNSDDPNNAFWKDDAIEIVVDALADRLDNNTDSSQDPYGGHSYVNFEGRFSAWDDATGAISGSSWATAVDWTYGATGDIFGTGKAVPGGWQMEVRFNKRLFEDPEAQNKLRDGYRMGFNIGLDDDDKHGIGANGDQSRAEDLEIQYFWANRQRRIGFNTDYLEGLTPEDRAAKVWLLDPNIDPRGLPLGVDSAGRLAHGGTGEIIFGYDTNATAAAQNILFVTSNADSPVNADPAFIALLRAKGYTVTPITPTDPEELRAAAEGKQLIILSETVGSGTVVDPFNDATGVFAFQETDVPVISFESFMYDNADWVRRTEDGSNDFTVWGNTGRIEAPEEIQDARDSLHIRQPAHPIAGGLTGQVKVHEYPYSLSYGIPSADADVVASAQPDGSYPVIFVYEKGDQLANGSPAANMRIGLFIGQVASPNANWPTDYADLTAEGRALFLNTVAYALGTGTSQPGTLELSATRAANRIRIVWTDSAAALESSTSLTGPWTPVANATSPFEQEIGTGTQQFYRLRR